MLEARYRRCRDLLAAGPAARAPAPADIAACLEFARDALRGAAADLAAPLLEALTGSLPALHEAWRLLGFALRDEQRLDDSVGAFTRAVLLQPGDALCALGLAEASYLSGLPAAHLFARALALAPGDLHVTRGRALALAADGDPAAAEALLVATLAQHADWLEGHRSLAALRWTLGQGREFSRSYAEACRRQPQSVALRVAWFSALAQAREWDAALDVIGAAERLIGPRAPFTAARLFVASENGDRALAERLFAATAGQRDDVRDLAFVRHCLRGGEPGRAEEVARRLTGTPAAAGAWPYLSLIWRLRDDPRAAWLDGAPPFIRSFDLPFAAADLAALATLLRRLHTAKNPYLEQSVRGGTQTDGQLFFRPEPVIARTRVLIEAAIRQYVASLPSPVPGHPLLGAPRCGRPLYAGGWSVRLLGGGYNVCHTHPQGWLSSALYVALPSPHELGPAPSGWISFGSAPPELGLGLPDYADIEPRVGRLVLFPRRCGTACARSAPVSGWSSRSTCVCRARARLRIDWRRGAALAHDQLGRQHARARPLAVDDREQSIDQCRAGLGDRLADRRQRRMEILRHRDVVVADDTDILRHEQPVLAQRRDRARGEQVAAGDDRIERDLPLQDVLDLASCAVLGEGRAPREARVRLDAVLRERPQVALEAVADLGQVRIAEERDAAPARRDQVVRRQHAAGDVVAADRAVQLLRQLRAPDHERQVARGQLVELVVAAPLPDQDHADRAARRDQLRGEVRRVASTRTKACRSRLSVSASARLPRMLTKNGSEMCCRVCMS